MPSEALPSQRITQVLHEGFADPTAGPRRRLDQAALVDGWLTELWAAAGAPASGAALAAIGSLGRQDLGPGSDLDLVLLLDPAVLDAAGSERLASALW
ncbi:MAG: protein-PII uridylyltransferase, partial [Brachybacterium tyrofermentans]